MTLFQSGVFVLHSKDVSDWTIDCSVLSDEDLDTLAHIGSHLIPEFGEVIGIPNGGKRFGNAMWAYRSAGPMLIVDDVYTTGDSMNEAKKNPDDIGLVIFARNPVKEAWITPIFTLTKP